MLQDCVIHNNDLVLYLSVLVVLVLLFPLIDLIILRVAWFYKDDLFVIHQGKEKPSKPSARKRDSYFSRSISSYSGKSHPIHPLTKTEATLVFSNEDSRGAEYPPDHQRELEDTIVYGKSMPSQFAVRGAQIERTSQFSRSAEENTLKWKLAAIDRTASTQGRTATRIESLPGIESPSLREPVVRKPYRAASPMKKLSEDSVEHSKTDSALPEVTRVTPISELGGKTLPPIAPAAVQRYKTSEFMERIADTSVLYQGSYNLTYINSRTELIETSSRESTPVQGDRKLLNRPDNHRRKVSRLDASLSPEITPK